jgi:deferrochelatase/peroxidase EfeB
MAPTPQAGILNRPPDHTVQLAYTLSATEPAGARATLEALRAVLKDELRSHLAPFSADAKDQPSGEVGELGFEDRYDRYHLTATLGLGAGLFDLLGIAADQRPQDLIDIPWSRFGTAPTRPANGQLWLQLCSDAIYVIEHVVRRVERELAGQITRVWAGQGAQRHTSRAGRPSRNEGRALIGFLDGTSNLNPRSHPEDRALVFVDPDRCGEYPPLPQPGQPSPYGGPQPPTFPTDLRPSPTHEPEWTRGGTYVATRASLIDHERWDATTLGDQEHAVGRFKRSGDPLGGPDDPTTPPAEPDFSADPGGTVTPLDSHIRKANPRGPQDALRRVYRRGYPIIETTLDGVRRGLLFTCFARTLSGQFEFIEAAWLTNPNFPVPGAGVDRLRAFESEVLFGGYFFVPALEHPSQPWSWILPS